LSRLHTHLCEVEERILPASARHHRKANAGEATRGETRADATPARARPRAGPLAGKRCARTPRLLRGTRQQPCCQSIPDPGDPALVQGTPPSQSAPPSELGTDEPPFKAVAPACPGAVSLPGSALRRSHLRQEPSAVVPLAGICAGGRPQGRSLPRPARSTCEAAEQRRATGGGGGGGKGAGQGEHGGPNTSRTQCRNRRVKRARSCA